MARDEQSSTVDPVRAEDPQDAKKKDGKDGPPHVNGIVDGKKKDAEEQLSEEDASLKSELEMLVERLKEPDTSLYRPALESMRTLIRTSTSSMTSVPKPLKFLRPHYPELQKIFDAWPSTSGSTQTNGVGAKMSDKNLFADILSVLAMTYSDSGKRDTLNFRLKGGSDEDPGLWGHEYVRHLAAEIGEDFAARQRQESKSAESTADLHALALRLVPFLLAHNGEADAVDLLLELESIASIVNFVDADSYARVCLYMVSCVNLLVPPDDREFLETARQIYRKQNRLTQALTLSIRMNDREMMLEDFRTAKTVPLKRQLAYILARQQIAIDVDDESDAQALSEILSNAKLSEHFKSFGTTLNLTDPRSLEDTYKTHLESQRPGASNLDSARQNLAGTFVNAFVNAGFGNDKLLVGAEAGNSWIYKNKDHGMLSAAASLGVSLLWDPEAGLDQIDKYTYASEEYIKAGALLATGIIHSGIRSEMDAAKALLEDHVESKSVPLRISAIIGLGIAYAGSSREDVVELLLPAVSDTIVSMEIASLSALALGFICAGSCNGDVAMAILQTMMEREDGELKQKWARFMALGLALLYIGRQDDSDVTIETLKAIEHPIGKQALVLVEVCSFAGTGNVLNIQNLLRLCTEHVDVEKGSDLHQALAVLGIAVVAMGEEVGAEMSLRQFNHLMHYGEPVIRRAVPLALGLISISNPQLTILDTLSKYSHDNDLEVALCAIFAMGLVGSGTNNARLAQMLRQLASYYHKDADCLFMVRIAQGLVHMGKGTIGLLPFHTDRFIMSHVAVSGLLAALVAFTDVKGFILEKQHWMLFFLVPSMYPRFLITQNEEGEKTNVAVRVGQAVDTVGQAGRPKTISGFQTHQTPVRMSTTERAELATEEFISYSHVLEGVVLLAKNAGWDAMDTN